jgi:hypothetical protein
MANTIALRSRTRGKSPLLQCGCGNFAPRMPATGFVCLVRYLPTLPSIRVNAKVPAQRDRTIGSMRSAAFEPSWPWKAKRGETIDIPEAPPGLRTRARHDSRECSDLLSLGCSDHTHRDSRKCMCFKCPTCGKINCHGIENGHRAAGCFSCWPGGYIVELAERPANRMGGLAPMPARSFELVQGGARRPRSRRGAAGEGTSLSSAWTARRADDQALDLIDALQRHPRRWPFDGRRKKGGSADGTSPGLPQAL